jgi:hypothetical protein
VTAKKATPAKKTAVARKKAAAPPKPTTEEVKTALAVLDAAKVGSATWVYEEVVRLLPLEERPPSVDHGSVDVTITGPDTEWTKAQMVAIDRAIRAGWPELKVTAGKAEFIIKVDSGWQG